MTMKKTLCAAALLAALIPTALAQDNHLPEASLDRELNLQGPDRAAACSAPRRTPTPPTYCKPCLFYAGDFDSNASDANGLANEVDRIVFTGAAVYTPFVVPKRKTWTITGLFTSDAAPGSAILDPPTSPYEVRKGIPAIGGNGGKLVCHGRLKSTAVPTGLIAVEWPIYAVTVKGIKGCTLKSGKYWMSVVPYCTNPNDSDCQNYRTFLMNDDGPMAHRFGPLEPANDSFFNSVFFGANWEPSSDVQSSARFSVGVEGTSTGR